MYKSKIKLGILGGGQLGRMTMRYCIDLDVETYVLSPDEDSPCNGFSNYFFVGDFTDFDTVVEFGSDLDVVTIEIENVNVEALKHLQKSGVKVFPQPEVIELIQDKGSQKEFYHKHDLPTSEFVLIDDLDDLAKVKDMLPVVQKLRREGYDGRGVCVLDNEQDFNDAFDAPSVIEKKVDLAGEIAVIVARNEKGEVKAFPPVDLEFNPEANLVEFLYTPSVQSEKIQNVAIELAVKVAEKMGIVGLLAVEMFIDQKGNVLVNEVAPRPHNSGHSTIEANVTSQFEQHLRAILGLSLGDTSIVRPAVMINLLGAEGFAGEVQYKGVDKALAVDDVHIHLYGKKMTKPFRKMGHVNVLAESLEKAKEKAMMVKKIIKVEA